MYLPVIIQFKELIVKEDGNEFRMSCEEKHILKAHRVLKERANYYDGNLFSLRHIVFKLGFWLKHAQNN